MNVKNFIKTLSPYICYNGLVTPCSHLKRAIPFCFRVGVGVELKSVAGPLGRARCAATTI